MALRFQGHCFFHHSNLPFCAISKPFRFGCFICRETKWAVLQLSAALHSFWNLYCLKKWAWSKLQVSTIITVFSLAFSFSTLHMSSTIYSFLPFLAPAHTEFPEGEGCVWGGKAQNETERKNGRLGQGNISSCAVWVTLISFCFALFYVSILIWSLDTYFQDGQKCENTRIDWRRTCLRSSCSN